MKEVLQPRGQSKKIVTPASLRITSHILFFCSLRNFETIYIFFTKFRTIRQETEEPSLGFFELEKTQTRYEEVRVMDRSLEPTGGCGWVRGARYENLMKQEKKIG